MTTPGIPLFHPFMAQDIPSLVAERTRSRPDHPFLIWHPFDDAPRTWTYGIFARDVERLAAGLLTRGIGQGDRVLIHLDNCPELLLAWYACARIGAVGVTTNARSSADELSYFAEHARVSGAITQPAFADLVAKCVPMNCWLAVTNHDAGLPADPGRRPALVESFDALLGDPATVPSRPADPMASVGIQYTSGTTSRPKGVVWTHANALWGARVNAAHEDLRAEDVHLVYLPLFHTNAQAYSVLAALWAGATAVLLPRWSTSRFWDLSVKYKCTWTSMIWFCLNALAEAPAPERHFYRLWGNGMCSPPQDERFGVKTLGWWGMTETISHGVVGHTHLENRSMAIGKPAPEYGVAIHRDDGSLVEPGETGNLKILGVRGVSLFKEYLDNTEATDGAYDANSWFNTGDQVTLHEDGFIGFSGRDKDMLKIGGENVAAAEIERVLMELPEVAEVAVVARKHKMLDEEPVALLLVHGGPDAVDAGLLDRAQAACRAKLADFKVPAEFRVMEAFPRSTLEKIAKAQLRTMLDDERTQ
ncbi:MAG: AMP-binding protein [Alphaproteobacteria bacterium]|nr:AMP-binding protein [Alphaproteobacteria bacterium]